MHFDHQLRVRELQSTGVGMRVRDQNISFSASCAERRTEHLGGLAEEWRGHTVRRGTEVRVVNCGLMNGFESGCLGVREIAHADGFGAT